MRRCARCKRDLAVSEFGPKKDKASGLESAGQVAGVGEVELMRAWLAGYEARQRIALADTQSELDAALGGAFSPPQSPDPT